MASTTKQMQVQAGNAQATVNATVTDGMPAVPCPNPAGYRYIGARYVPKFADPIDWDQYSTYEPLTIVTYNGNSYTSKKFVPAGIKIDNEDYWVSTGNYNGQVDIYRKETERVANDLDSVKESLDNEIETRTNEDKALNTKLDSVYTAVGNISSGSPEIVNSLGDMTDTTKLYVLSTDGHIYMWSGSAWTDTGVEYASSNAVIFDRFFSIEDTPTGIYTDLNTLTANSIVAYSSTDSVANTPAKGAALVLTFGIENKQAAESYACTVQVFSELNNGYLWYRYSSAYGGAITEWTRIETNVFTFIATYGSSNAPDGYKDLNDLKCNSMVVYGDTENIANTPETSALSVMTFGSNADTFGTNEAGQFQMAVNLNSGDFWYRTHLATGAISSWFKVPKQAVEFGGFFTFDQVPLAPYDDMNTVPPNTVACYGDLSSVKNIPPHLNSGTLITFGRPGVSVSSGSYTCVTQMFFSYETADIWKRVSDGYTGGMSEWSNIINDAFMFDKLVSGEDVSTAPYNDLNSLQCGRMVVYVESDGVLNKPFDTAGSVITLGAVEDTFGNGVRGQIQIATDLITSNMWYRVHLGTNNISPWNPMNGNTDYGSISLFPTIGVIGDSYASGWIQNKSGSGYTEQRTISWPQIMARKYGIEATNFTYSGLTFGTWLTNDDYGLPKLQSDSAKDLYLIALGINDQNQSYTLGTAADMTDNPTSNPDTFYGNADKTVYYIKQKAPNSKIIVIGIANPSTDYNNALKEVAEHNGIPFIDTQSDEYFASSYFTNNKVGGHPISITYSGMADAYARLIADTFSTYTDYYKDFMAGA